MGEYLKRVMRGSMAVIIAAGLLLAAGSGEDGEALEPKAEEILFASCNYLKSAGEFEFSADVTYDEVDASGLKTLYSGTFSTAVKRPDRLRSAYRGDDENRAIWYDGRRLTLLDRDENLFASMEAPPLIDQFLDLTVSQLGFTVPGADLLYSDPFPALKEKVVEGRYAGKESVNGVSCHRLSFSQQDIDWQIWIEAGERKVPRKLTITYKELPGSPTYTALFPAWDFSSSLEDDQFLFRPPEGSEKIDFLLSGGEKGEKP